MLQPCRKGILPHLKIPNPLRFQRFALRLALRRCCQLAALLSPFFCVLYKPSRFTYPSFARYDLRLAHFNVVSFADKENTLFGDDLPYCPCAGSAECTTQIPFLYRLVTDIHF